MGLETAMCTLAAMANPRSSFRDEFQKMGGIACVGLCYLFSDVPERQNVFDQVLRGVTNEEFKVLSPENAFSFFNYARVVVYILESTSNYYLLRQVLSSNCVERVAISIVDFLSAGIFSPYSFNCFSVWNTKLSAWFSLSTFSRSALSVTS